MIFKRGLCAILLVIVLPAATPQQNTPQSPALLFVLIETRSAAELQQLRRWPIDIVRVKPSTQTTVTEPPSLNRPMTVEAVIDRSMLNKLRQLGLIVLTPQ